MRLVYQHWVVELSLSSISDPIRGHFRNPERRDGTLFSILSYSLGFLEHCCHFLAFIMSYNFTHMHHHTTKTITQTWQIYSWGCQKQPWPLNGIDFTFAGLAPVSRKGAAGPLLFISEDCSESQYKGISCPRSESEPVTGSGLELNSFLLSPGESSFTGWLRKSNFWQWLKIDTQKIDEPTVWGFFPSWLYPEPLMQWSLGCVHVSSLPWYHHQYDSCYSAAFACSSDNGPTLLDAGNVPSWGASTPI